MVLACHFPSSPQGSEGRNTHLRAVPNDAVLVLSVRGMDVSVCARVRACVGLKAAVEEEGSHCVMGRLMHLLVFKWDIFPSCRLLCF